MLVFHKVAVLLEFHKVAVLLVFHKVAVLLVFHKVAVLLSAQVSQLTCMQDFVEWSQCSQDSQELPRSNKL